MSVFVSLRRARRVFRASSTAAFFAVCACSGSGSPPVYHSPMPVMPSPSPTASMPMQTATVPLMYAMANQNPGPHLMVALPSASPVAVLFDTGSTGLRLLPTAMSGVPASAYTDTGTGTSYVFGGNRVYYGDLGVASAGVTLGGGLHITKTLNFQIVKKVCEGNVPMPVPTAAPADCNDITTAAESDVGGGIIGVRPTTGTMSLSPLAELPAPYDSGFIVSFYGSSPTLTAGATSTNQTGFETYAVGAATAADGSPAWMGNETPPWCYSVTVPGQGTSPQACPSNGVLSDTGGNSQTLALPGAPPGSLAPNTSATLPPGSTITATLTAAGAATPSITWTYTTGTCKPYNDPNVYFIDPSASPAPTSSPPGSTNGVTPFFTNDVLYDLQNGVFGFRPVTPMLPPFCM